MEAVRPGDILLLKGKTFLGRVINWFQAYYDGQDGKSEVTHAAIIISQDILFETTSWRTGFNPISEYDGSEIEIWRHNPADYDWRYAFDAVEGDQKGRVFPYWRWPLFMVHLAKLIHGRSMVCSEVVACFLYFCGLLPSYWGYDVDMLRDHFATTPGWRLIYSGKGRDR